MGLIVFTLSWTAVLANYLVFVSHSLPARTKPKTHDYGLLQMRETWDILPQSKIAMFLHIGFGAHASHHIFGYVPRQLLPIVSKELKKAYPKEYRCVDTVFGELKLIWNRHQVM
eukprot:1130727_1